jgi:glycine/serine hydroxymethyltransferase
MNEADMEKMAGWIVDCLQNPEDDEKLEAIRVEVEAFCKGFPVPGI